MDDCHSAQRGKAFGLLAAGWSLGKVARELGVTKSAISKLRSRGVRLGEDKAVMGDMGKGGRKKLATLANRGNTTKY